MDIGSILGILAGAGLIGFAILSGSSSGFAAFINAGGLMIVVGGTLAATAIAFPTKELKLLIPVLARVFRNPKTEILTHDDGIRDADTEEVYPTQKWHDPSDIHEARRLATNAESVRLGLFYWNPSQPRYDETRTIPMQTAEEKIAHLERELDRNAV